MEPRTAADDSPEEIRRDMARTRQALEDKLLALRDRLIGADQPGPSPRGATVVKSKGTTKKAGKAKRPTAKAKATGSATRTKAKATPAGRKPAAKGKKAGPARKKPARRKSTASKLMTGAKNVLGDVLTGAATGAVAGAMGVVAHEAAEVSDQADKAARKPGW